MKGLEPNTDEKRERQRRAAVVYKIGYEDLLSGGSTLGGDERSVFFILPVIEAGARAEYEAFARADGSCPEQPSFRPYDQISELSQHTMRKLLYDLDPHRVPRI